MRDKQFLEGERKTAHQDQHIPTAIYTTDPDGILTSYNPRAAELWGRRPRLNDPSETRYCGSVKLFNMDGTPPAT